MHEILARLSATDRVLDLGCAHGSFPDEHTAARVIRADLEPRGSFPRRVACDARRLPFAGGSFTAAILNHSLEHFEEPESVLTEVRRVVRSDGYLYVAVPDSSTVTDRIYRWLGRGGGHVNPFTDAAALAERIERATGLPHRGTRVLFTSLSFLNRRNIPPGRAPRKLILFGGGSEGALRVATRVFRAVDRRFGTRLAVYGWAFCFGAPVDFDPAPRSNVCVRCGSGHYARELRKVGSKFQCPCGAWNYFTED